MRAGFNGIALVGPVVFDATCLIGGKMPASGTRDCLHQCCPPMLLMMMEMLLPLQQASC